MSFPVALQLYSVRDAMKADFFGTLKKVKDMGYDGVEFAGLMGNAPEEIKSALDDIGLVPVAAHIAMGDFDADLDRRLEEMKIIGAKYVVVPSVPQEYRPDAGGDFVKAFEKFRTIAEAAKKEDMMLLYHNHDFEFIKIGDKYALDLLYETLPADLLQTELDTCWINVGGENPANYVRKYAGRAPVVHIKDFIGEKSENMYELIGEKTTALPRKAMQNFAFRSVGEGKQDIPAILNACRDAGTSWLIVEQDQPTEGLDPLTCAQMSVTYLNSIQK